MLSGVPVTHHDVNQINRLVTIVIFSTYFVHFYHLYILDHHIKVFLYFSLPQQQHSQDHWPKHTHHWPKHTNLHYYTIHYFTVLHRTEQYSTAQYGTEQCSTGPIIVTLRMTDMAISWWTMSHYDDKLFHFLCQIHITFSGFIPYSSKTVSWKLFTLR